MSVERPRTATCLAAPDVLTAAALAFGRSLGEGVP
jgi:hypothetical protein